MGEHRSYCSALVWVVALWVCLLADRTAAAEVTAADFDVEADQINATVERLAGVHFADVARPAATVLALRKPKFILNRDPRMSDAEHEAHRRKYESPAYTVARLVWSRHTTEAGTKPVAGVLGTIATDLHGTDAEVRRVAIQTLAMDALSRRVLTEHQRAPLYAVAVHNKDHPGLRRLAAEALMHAPPAAEQADQHDSLLRHLPGIIRAQPTLADRHSAFSDLANIGNRLYRLPVEHFNRLIRLGFDLIEETPADTAAGAYGTARRLGFMLKRPDEFVPPRDEHKDATGNLAPSFFLQTVKNARQWWDESGRAAMDEIAPAEANEDGRRGGG